MKNILIALISMISIPISTLSQNSGKTINSSYRYYSNPGYVNITEINGASGLGTTELNDSKYYFGITNVFGYQIDRHFFGGLGVGYYIYDTKQFLPVYLEFRYSRYLKYMTPFIFTDGGSLLDPESLIGGTKLFINPGIGISRSISSKFEITLSSGLTVQMGDSLPRNSFINFKIGILFRKKSFRLYNPMKNVKYF